MVPDVDPPVVGSEAVEPGGHRLVRWAREVAGELPVVSEEEDAGHGEREEVRAQQASVVDGEPALREAAEDGGQHVGR